MCYKIVSISAVSEWLLTIFWLAFILSIAHDIWFLVDVREAFFQFQNYKPVQEGDRSHGDRSDGDRNDGDGEKKPRNLRHRGNTFSKVLSDDQFDSLSRASTLDGGRLGKVLSNVDPSMPPTVPTTFV